MSANDESLWALAVLEAYDRTDIEGILALVGDVEPHVAVARIAGLTNGLVYQLCLLTGVSPGVWLAEARAELIAGEAA